MVNYQGRVQTLYRLLDKAKAYGDEEQIQKLEAEIQDLRRQQNQSRAPRPYGNDRPRY